MNSSWETNVHGHRQRGGGCAWGGEGVSQLPAGQRGQPSESRGRERRRGGGGCPGSAPARGKLCAGGCLGRASRLHPAQPLMEGAGQGPPSQTLTEAGMKCKATFRCRSAWAGPQSQTVLPSIPDQTSASAEPSLPAAGVAGARGRCQENKSQQAGCGRLHLGKGEQGRRV